MSPHQTFFKSDIRPAALERADRRTARTSVERREKALVRARDRVCRWPRCECKTWKMPLSLARLEVAHLTNKGMGGDHGLRSTADQMILLCYSRHQGIVSLHSGHLRIVPLTRRGTAGPCRFQVMSGGQWRTMGAERAVGALRGAEK